MCDHSQEGVNQAALDELLIELGRCEQADKLDLEEYAQLVEHIGRLARALRIKLQGED